MLTAGRSLFNLLQQPLYTTSLFANTLRFASRLVKKMEENQVVPDVISVVPEGRALICYPSGVTVTEGTELTPTQVKDQPKVSWEADDSKYYTLCMTDPDAPSRKEPTYREWHHWLVGNIPGREVSQGQVLSAYVGAGPPQATGLHRYVFLIYQQPDRINFEDVEYIPSTTAANRDGFSIRKFATKYKLGNPIAGNFFQAQYDDYVDSLYKTFTG